MNGFRHQGVHYGVGDVVYLESGRPDRPWIGRIDQVHHNKSRITVRWFMRPADVEVCGAGAQVQFHPRELLYSTRFQEYEMRHLRGKCRVHRVEGAVYAAPALGPDEYLHRFLYDVHTRELHRAVTMQAAGEPTRKRPQYLSTVKLLQNVFGHLYGLTPVPVVPWLGHEVFQSTVALWLHYLFDERQGDMVVAMAVIRGERHTQREPTPHVRGQCGFCGTIEALAHRVQDSQCRYSAECLDMMMDIRQLYQTLDIDLATRRRYYQDREAYEEFIREVIRRWRRVSEKIDK